MRFFTSLRFVQNDVNNVRLYVILSVAKNLNISVSYTIVKTKIKNLPDLRSPEGLEKEYI